MKQLIAKILKRASSIIILFVLLSSCGSKKKVVSTNEYVTEDLSTIILKEETKKELSNKIDVSFLEGKITITEIEYDTTKPADTTGRPIIKKETTSIIDFAKKDTTVTDTTIDHTVNTKEDTSKRVESDKSYTSESEREESSFMSYLYKIIVSIIVVIFSVLIYKAFSLFTTKK